MLQVECGHSVVPKEGNQRPRAEPTLKESRQEADLDPAEAPTGPLSIEHEDAYI